ncbi:M48 family metalloprotease [Hydrogenophaga pseudoflava]|uniref:M48 family metalloprotease n=1 Tax=Hydrogenophaga pseudoflava TaxID=47421 RepID=UPI0008256889|nr:M48 family metalloprotease [Hydrogenophaga pseudoflava]
MPRLLASALLLAATLLAGCGTTVVNPVTGQSERTVMDERTELAEGKKAHDEVLKEYGVYKDERLQAYVNEVGQKLAKQSHRANIPWTFTVLDSPEINAFALPGGYVYITRGILAYMESEADMAGVIGHEIGHVTARHGAQRATRQQTAGLGVLAATVLGAVLESKVGVSGGTEMFGQMAQGVAAGYVAKYSREQELQADSLGAEYLARSNYDPRNMIDVIRVLKLQEAFAVEEARAEGRPAPEGANWLSSHPSNDQRLQQISQNAAKYQGSYASDGAQRFLQVVRGMRFGESPEQGLTRGQNFYHAGLGLAMTAPAGWRIQNEPEALTIVAPQGDAALRMVAMPPRAGSTHDEIIRNALQPSEGKVTRGQINGFAATHFVGVRKAQNGQSQAIEATVVTGPKNNSYVMLYLAADAAARNRAMPGLVSAEKSFRAMTAADQQAARPWVVQTVPLPRGGFTELARQSPLTEKRLQLLNGTWGRSDPPVGQVVKTVVEQ